MRALLPMLRTAWASLAPKMDTPSTSASALMLTNRRPGAVPGGCVAAQSRSAVKMQNSSKSASTCSRCACSSSAMGVCQAVSRGPRIKASWAYTPPARKSPKGWNTQCSAPARIRRASTPVP